MNSRRWSGIHPSRPSGRQDTEIGPFDVTQGREPVERLFGNFEMGYSKPSSISESMDLPKAWIVFSMSVSV